jgi:hypothetical protein
LKADKTGSELPVDLLARLKESIATGTPEENNNHYPVKEGRPGKSKYHSMSLDGGWVPMFKNVKHPKSNGPKHHSLHLPRGFAAPWKKNHHVQNEDTSVEDEKDRHVPHQ